MHPRRVVASLVGLLFCVGACATGTVSSTGGGTGGDGDKTDDAGGSSSSYGGDSGAGREAGPIHPIDDSGTTTPIDSGSSPPIDSGTPPTGDNCVGTESSQLGDTYDDACDNYYFNTGGESNNCRSGKTDCASLDGTSGFDKFCCYVPPSGSFCDDDYASTPQCIPQ
ncbi:MAG: hypothetical protein ACRELY_27935 [Polyangiaceae bacterium]